MSFTHRQLTSSYPPSPIEPGRLNSRVPGTLYFAYGSNLSPTQMTLRCTSTPERSGKPIAIARLHGWKWFICARGCANVTYTGTVTRRYTRNGDLVANGDECDEVWGVVYDMGVEDEAILDRFEHVDWAARVITSEDGEGREKDCQHRLLDSAAPIVKPTEQGNGNHNKLYVDAEIMEWKVKASEQYHQSRQHQGAQRRESQWVRVLLYVDEQHTTESAIRENYIGRMNRGIQEAVQLGLSQQWIDKVVRPHVPEGIDAPVGFVGVI